MNTATPLKSLAITEFEAWVQTQPDAIFWNTLDAMQAAWVAAKAAPSPAWCASVDAELAATADADAQPVEVQRVPTADLIENAAYFLAGAFDYPWDHMPEQGRENMRKHVRMVMDALGIKPTSSAVPTLPAAAVAEGLERDGDALEQAS